MGFVVYETNTGRAMRYYKKAGVAKAQATKYNKQLTWDILQNGHRNIGSSPVACCDWSEFESVVANNLSYEANYHKF